MVNEKLRADDCRSVAQSFTDVIQNVGNLDALHFLGNDDMAEVDNAQV